MLELTLKYNHLIAGHLLEAPWSCPPFAGEIKNAGAYHDVVENTDRKNVPPFSYHDVDENKGLKLF